MDIDAIRELPNVDIWDDGTIEIEVPFQRLTDIVDKQKCLLCDDILVKSKTTLAFQLKANPKMMGIQVGCKCGGKWFIHPQFDISNLSYGV